MTGPRRENGRTLAVGDRIAARPCVVTIEQRGTIHAYGHCSTCVVPHVIDLLHYERGDGPWQPVEPSSADGAS